MPAFTWTKTETPAGPLVAFQGKLDDESDLNSVDLGSGPNLTLDLSGVRLINSLGIRQWILWWESKLVGRAVKLRGCPKVMIDQANIVKSFFPAGATVESLFVPYFCDSCDETTNVLLENGKHFRMTAGSELGEVTLPANVACPSCSKPMELDVDESRYFRFLKRSS